MAGAGQPRPSAAMAGPAMLGRRGPFMQSSKPSRSSRAVSVWWSVGTRIGRDLWRAAPDLIAFEVLFQLVSVALIAPPVTWLFRRVVAAGGDLAVGNFEIALFLLEPRGAVAASVVIVLVLATVFLQFAGFLYIGLGAASDRRLTYSDALRRILQRAPRVFGVSFLGLLVALVVILPFAAGIGATYQLLLSTYDINYYLDVRPPEFVTAVVIAGALGLAAAAAAAVVYVLLVFAVPLVVLSRNGARRAFALSYRMVRRDLGVIAGALLGWLIAWAALSATVNLLIGQLAGLLIHLAGSSMPRLLVVLGSLAALDLAAVVLLAFIGLVFNALLIAHLFRRSAGRCGIELEPLPEAEPLGPRPRWRLKRKGPLLVASLLVVVAVLAAFQLLESLQLENKVEITAHRGSSLAAPENTLAAIRRAVEDGADYVEIDVQLSADGVLVVNHDADLMRVAASPRVVATSTFAELRQVDVGSRFGAEFVGERLPSLDEVLDAVRDRSRIDVELKSYGGDGERLVRAVVETLREREMIGQAVVMSLVYEEVKAVRRLAPEIPVGFVASASIGRLERLDVDFFAISQGLATEARIAAMHAGDKEVWVWTVDDPAAASRLIDRGVDNLITNTPGRMVELLAERSELENFERVLLRYRNLRE